jgi:hypothetical protein
MPLGPGTRLGAYEILAPIGEGGMGEVYRARDAKLGRDVAVKVLPEAFAEDRERLDRFEREARLLAQLNHHNIATLHGLETFDEKPFLVMELVEGETLAERIARGPIPVDEAVPLFIQIAEGLEAAHEKGIVHRDLKPANVKLTPDGKVKILDFGLAKAYAPPRDVSAETSESPTQTRGTALGVIMGTAAYMSPEQARGKPVDRQTDIFAYGCCFFEALTAKKPFWGETVTDTITAVIHQEPDWLALPPSAPTHVLRLLRRCLQKKPSERMRDIGDARLELEDVDPAPPAANESRRERRLAFLLPLVIGVGLAAYLAGKSGREPQSATTAWEGEKLGGPTVASFPVVSPDETLVAFLALDRGLTQVAVMQPGGRGESRQLTHDRNRGIAAIPAWSPDGSRIYYDRSSRDGSSVYSVSSIGESDERLVLEDASDPSPLPDGSLLAVRTNEDRLPQLIRYEPGTNRVEWLPIVLVSTLQDHSIEVVPGAREIVVAGRPMDSPASDEHLYSVDLSSGGMRRLAPDVELPPFQWTFPISVTEGEAYISRPAGGLYEIVAVALDGSPGARSIVSLTRRPLGIDIARDGTLYFDQIDQATALLRFDVETESIERFYVSADYVHLLPMPDDRFLVAPRSGAGDRLMIIAPPNAPVPFLVDNDEEARGPMALVGESSIAFPIGPSSEQEIALASLDGRLERRIPIQTDGAVTGLAGSPDGSTLYYATKGEVFRLSIRTADTSELGTGDEIAVDPVSGELVVLRRGHIAELVRMSPDGGSEEPISVEGEWRIHGLGITNLMANSVSEDGRVVVRILPPASWFFPVGVLDSYTGGPIVPFEEPSDTDMQSAVWDRQGRVVVIAKPYRSELWRFRPTERR